MQIKRLLSEEQIAEQIAHLVNKHNQWNMRFYGRGINRSSATYIVESYLDIVLGVVGIERKNNNWSEIKHLVVRPELRSKGLGKKLVRRALEEVKTPYVLANIRSTNKPSLRVFYQLGFSILSQKRKSYYNLITAIRSKNDMINNIFLSIIRGNKQ